MKNPHIEPIPTGQRLPEDTRAGILHLIRTTKLSARDIAAKCGVSVPTVINVKHADDLDKAK